MATLEQYREWLREAETEIERLAENARETEAHARFLRRKIAEHESTTRAFTFPTLPPLDLQGKTIPEAVADVLRARGTLHVRDITQELVAGGFPARDNLQTTVTTACFRKKDLFQKVGRGRFALKNGAMH